MTDLINDIVFPAVLFIAYFTIASLVIQEIECKYSAYPSNSDTINQKCLQTRSLKDLKAIASELNISPTGNKSYKSTWIEAIISAKLDLTILPIELVKLVGVEDH